MNISTFNF